MMLFTYLGVICVIFTVIPFGLLAVRILQFLIPNIGIETDGFLIGIWGLCTLSFLTNLFSLFISINLPVYCGIAVISISLITFYWQNGFLKQVNFDLSWLKNPILALTFLVSLGTLTIEAGFTVDHYDTGLYHAQYVQWLNQFPIVPGLGNLHSRFALNSAWTSLGALFSFPFLFKDPARFLDPFLRIWIFCYLASKAQKILHSGLNKSRIFAFFLFVCYITIFPLLTYSRSLSLSTDVPASLLSWLVFFIFLEKIDSQSGFRWNISSFEILFFTIFAITVKLSCAPLVLLPLYVFIMTYSSHSIRYFIRSIVLAIFFVIPWFAQNFLLSGYFLFPLAVNGIVHPDWQVPMDVVLLIRRAIFSWARIPDAGYDAVLALPFLKWFPTWLHQQPFYFILMSFWALGVNVVLLISDGIHTIKEKIPFTTHMDIWIIRLTTIIGTLYWFITAPDIRFGLIFLIPLFCMAFVPNFVFRMPLVSYSKIFVYGFSIPLIFSILFLLATLYIYRGIPSFVFQVDLPIVQTHSEYLDHDITIKVPDIPDRCWATEIPCTPKVEKGLTLRGTDFRSGFRIVRPVQAGFAN